MLENLIKNKEVKDHTLLSDSYLKLSQWTFDFKDQQKAQVPQNNYVSNKYQNQDNMNTQSQLTGQDFEKTIEYCNKATKIIETNNDAWHHFSQINYEASRFYSICFAESI